MKKSLSWKHITLISCCLVLAFVALMAVAILAPVGVTEEASAVGFYNVSGVAYNSNDFRFNDDSRVRYFGSNYTGLTYPFSAGLNLYYKSAVYEPSIEVVTPLNDLGLVALFPASSSQSNGFFYDFDYNNFDANLNPSVVSNPNSSGYIGICVTSFSLNLAQTCYYFLYGSNDGVSWVQYSASNTFTIQPYSTLTTHSNTLYFTAMDDSYRYWRCFFSFNSSYSCGIVSALVGNASCMPNMTYSQYVAGTFDIPDPVDPEPSPYDAWFGVTKSNAIVNNSDFYFVPVSEPALPSSLPSTALYDRWTMDAEDRRGFAYQEAMKAMRVYFNTVNSFESVTLKYRYRPVSGSSYLFTLSADFSQLDSFSVTLSCGLEGVSYFTETIDTLNDDTMLYSISCPAEFTSVGDMVITIEMNGPQNVSADVATYSYLYFSKLELDTTFFTGYEYPSHNQSYVVKANYMTNYDFADPVYNDGDTTRTNQWFVVPDADSSAIITIQDITGGGRSVSATNYAPNELLHLHYTLAVFLRSYHQQDH